MTHPSLLRHWKRAARQRGFILNPFSYSSGPPALTAPTFDTLLLALTAEEVSGGDSVDCGPFGWYMSTSGFFRSATQVKFGTYSYDTVVGDTLLTSAVAAPSVWFDLQRSTATVGFWLRMKNLSSVGSIVGQRNSLNGIGWVLSVSTGGEIQLTYNASVLTTSGAGIVANTWYHVLLSLSGGTAYLFVNGALLATGSVSFGVNTAYGQGVRVGGADGVVDLNGFVDDLFITDELLTTVPFATPVVALVGSQPGGYSYWNSSDKGSNVLVTAAGRSVYLNGEATGTIQSIRGTQGRAVGSSRYFEVSLIGGAVTSPSRDHQGLSGLGNSSATLSSYVGNDANGWSYYHQDGKTYHSNVASGSAYGPAGADTVGVWLTASGGIRFKTSASDPGTDAYSGLTGTLYPMWGSGTASGVHGASINTGATAFRWGLPAGASAWG